MCSCPVKLHSICKDIMGCSELLFCRYKAMCDRLCCCRFVNEIDNDAAFLLIVLRSKEQRAGPFGPSVLNWSQTTWLSALTMQIHSA